MAITITRPTVGASTDTWGTTLNTGLQALESTLNGSGTGKVTVAPDLSTLTVNGTAVTSTAAELNILDGVTASTSELNTLSGASAAAATTLVDADRVIVNDDGTMKQVALSDVKTYAGASDAAVTLTAGNALTGGGSVTLNQSADVTVTFDHEDTSSQASVSNTGNNVMQSVTLDDYGHVTALSSVDLSALTTATLGVATGSVSQHQTVTLTVGADFANKTFIKMQATGSTPSFSTGTLDSNGATTISTSSDTGASALVFAIK